jgi:hypothetical protein
MCYSRFLDHQQSSANPCPEYRQNMRESPKDPTAGGRNATLKKRPILRRWKLQFIPSDHSKRRAVALCLVLLLASVLVLAATGLIVYITTGEGAVLASVNAQSAVRRDHEP